MTTEVETTAPELEDEVDTSLDGLTPKEYYKKKGVPPEGYKVSADGKLRRTTREKKSNGDDFHKVARAFLVSAFGVSEDKLKLVKDPWGIGKTLYLQQEGRGKPLYDWSDVFKAVGLQQIIPETREV